MLSFDQSVDQTDSQSGSDLVICLLSQSVSQSVSQTVRQSDSQTVRQSDSQTVRQSDSQTVRQSDSQTQTVRQSDCQTFKQSDSQTASQSYGRSVHFSSIHLIILSSIQTVCQSVSTLVGLNIPLTPTKKWNDQTKAVIIGKPIAYVFFYEEKS